MGMLPAGLLCAAWAGADLPRTGKRGRVRGFALTVKDLIILTTARHSTGPCWGPPPGLRYQSTGLLSHPTRSDRAAGRLPLASWNLGLLRFADQPGGGLAHLAGRRGAAFGFKIRWGLLILRWLSSVGLVTIGPARPLCSPEVVLRRQLLTNKPFKTLVLGLKKQVVAF